MARLAFAHPSRQRLLAWLDATEENSGITEHVEQCDRCAAKIEELAEELAEEPESNGALRATSLGDALREAYEPPDDINDRVMEKIKQRRLADRELNVLFGLFSIPKDTVDLLLPSEVNEDTSSNELDEREH